LEVGPERWVCVPGARESWESREVAKVRVIQGRVGSVGEESGSGGGEERVVEEVVPVVGGRWGSRRARRSEGKWRVSAGVEEAMVLGGWSSIVESKANLKKYTERSGLK